MTQLIRSMFRRARRRGSDAATDLGFVMLTVIGYGVIIVLIASLLAVYTLNSIKGSRREQDFDAGVTAAQAGVDQVVAQLRSGTSPTALGNVDWTGVPGAVDVNNHPCTGSGLTGSNLSATCPQYKYRTTVDPSGNVTVYAEGRSRKASGGNSEVDRAVKVTLRQADYTDYLYYSEVEAADPADPLAYPRLFYPTGGPAVCGLQSWSATAGGQTRPASCKVPLWRNGDGTDGSTVHSNDLFQTQGSPTFNSKVTTEYAGCQATPANPNPTVAATVGGNGCYKSSDGATPNFQQGAPSYATGVVTPASVDNLPATATAAGLSECTYTGPTRIKFIGNQMEVWSPQTKAGDNPGKTCGGGAAPNLVSALQGLLGNLINLSTLPTDQLIALLGSAVASTPAPIATPSVIYVRDNPNNGTSPAPTGLFCLLGRTLGMYGTLDPAVDPNNVLNLLTNPEESSNCGSGELYVDGAFNGKSTVGTDGNVTIMSDLYYSDPSGGGAPGSDHDGTNQLGLISNGSVQVWNPVQCTLALTTCLSLSNLKDGLGHLTPLKVLGSDIHVEAAIMSTQHEFGVSLPLLQPSAYLSLLNGLATASVPTPKIDLYGSVYQKYRGALGVNLANVGVGLLGVDGSLTLNQTTNLDVGVDHVNLASAGIDLGYYANFTYDQHLRATPPPAFPTPATPTWVQDTFAEIPVAKLPAGF